MKFFAAPLQGFTEAPFRHFHTKIYGPDGSPDCYYAPFIRIEHGTVRAKELNDISSAMNSNHTVMPQVIARDGVEFSRLVEAVAATGHRHIDLNMGCPFPPQNHKGRGAALIANPAQLEEIRHVMEQHHARGLLFSVKMRLGMKLPDEWESVADILNRMPLTHVTIHPRTASQQYAGMLHSEELKKLSLKLNHKWVFNGDITTPEDIDRTRAEFPDAWALMIGRGLLGRPSLIAEWRNGSEWTWQTRIVKHIELHNAILNHFSHTLCGEAQILSKIKPFWTYTTGEFDRKQLKLINKATRLDKYEAAVASLIP